jgi:hypothetical protein
VISPLRKASTSEQASPVQAGSVIATEASPVPSELTLRPTYRLEVRARARRL